jgi:V8-like Glu-specific endopeptidase
MVCFFNRSDGTPICGGSISAPNYVLTAKHCLKSKDKADVKVLSIFNKYNMFQICFHQNPIMSVTSITFIGALNCKYAIKNIVFFVTYAFENRKRVFDSALFTVRTIVWSLFGVENKKGRLETLLAKNINIKVLFVLLCNN